MIKWAFRIIIIGILTLAGGGLAALLGHRQWLVALAGAIVVYFLAGFLIKTVAQRAFLVPFKLKGQVLHGARIQVHGMTLAEAPEPYVDEDDDLEDVDADLADDDDTDDEPEIPKTYYRLDLTITPTTPPGKMSHWEPGELLVVPLDSADGVDELAEGEDVGYVEEVEIFDGQEFVEDDPGKYEGAQRIRILVAVRSGLRHTKLRYYFESFGRLDLPRS